MKELTVYQGSGVLLEPFRKVPNVLLAPVRGKNIEKLLDKWSQRHFNNYIISQCDADVRNSERRFAESDAVRLIDSLPEPFEDVINLKDRSRRLVGASLRFGVAHGDLAPENIFLEGDDVIIEDWNNIIENAPVAMDLVFLAFTWAYMRGLSPSEIQSALGALRGALTPDEYAKRHDLLCLALLHWRTLREPSLWKNAKARIRAALRLAS